jgi:putative ATP-dependent endonuclease of OLD family
VVIEAASDQAFEQPYNGFEHLLRAEITPAMQAWFVRWFVAAGEWPQALVHMLPVDGSSDDAYIAPFLALFTHKKGDDFLTVFVEQCELHHLPRTVLDIIAELKRMAAPPLPPPQTPTLFD